MNLYFNGAVDVNWDTLGNWWEDSGFTTPASSIPVTNDTVFLEYSTSTIVGPSASITLAALYIAVNTSNTTLDCSGGAVTVTGGVILGSSGSNSGVFIGSISCDSFDAYHYSSNGGTVTVTVAATFHDYSVNSYVIVGKAIFNDTSYNLTTCTVGDNSIFNNSSYNLGIVGNNVTFNDNTYNTGTAGAGATFSINAAQLCLSLGYAFTVPVVIHAGNNGPVLNLPGNSLPASKVNEILAAVLANNFLPRGYLNLTGSAAPTGQGLTDKAALIAAPNYWTVLTS